MGMEERKYSSGSGPSGAIPPRAFEGLAPEFCGLFTGPCV